MWYYRKNMNMDFKILIIGLRNIDWKLNLAKIINPYRIIKMGNVSQASVAHPY